ncbi:MAG TPA: putative glycolipid-binding domain-containing protein [Gemmatimonadales bacterium]|nr:putative glycolipid-binding domain-containing protein [Gemmatimonadales bacterium]
MRWQRLDPPGTDECELVRLPRGWRVEGLAQFGAGRAAARLHYAVEADDAWRTRRAEVQGRVGEREIRLLAVRGAGDAWLIDGVPAPELQGLVDLDLGFTPATNLFPIRRLALEPGQGADAEAAWLDDERWTLRRLPQRYERRDERTYWYESPTAGYAALLTVTEDGFVSDYPGLWKAAR